MPVPTPLPSGPRCYPRPKFVWGAREVIAAHWRLGLFGFYARSPGFPFSGLAISVRGLLCWLLALSGISYAGGAYALSRWLARNPYNEIQFADVLAWPARREHVARLRAQGWLAQGKAAIREAHWSEAIFYLRRGLEVVPQDSDARLSLAEFYLLSGQRPRALVLLTDAPRHGLPSPAALRGELEVMFAGEDWNSALVLCDRVLAQLTQPDQWERRQWVLARKLAVLLALGRAREALTLAEAQGDATGSNVKLQHARALVAVGRTDEAIARLRQWRAATGAQLAPVFLPDEVTALRRAGRLDEMERALAELQIADPMSPDSLAFVVEERARAGRDAAAALEEFLFRHGRSPENLLRVAQPLARLPDVALVARVAAAAKERGYAPQPFAVELAQAQLRQGDLAAFRGTVERVAPQFAPMKGAAHNWYAWAHAMTESLSTADDAAAPAIVEHLRRHLVSLEIVRLSITALRRAGRDEIAREVIGVAQRQYPESPWLIAQQQEVEQALLARPLPIPVTSPVAAGPALPPTADEFFRQLGASLHDRHWTEAADLVAAARAARLPPDWLVARDGELIRAEIRIAHGQHRQPDLRALARVYLNGSAARAEDLLALAREWRAAHADDDAVLLVRAVRTKFPSHVVAASLLAEWQPATGLAGFSPAKE